MSRDPRELAQRIEDSCIQISGTVAHLNLDKTVAILAAEMPRWVPGRAKEFWLTLPHCCAYPKCDGDLVGELHSEECPLYQKTEMTRFEFAEAYAKWLQETP